MDLQEQEGAANMRKTRTNGNQNWTAVQEGQRRPRAPTREYYYFISSNTKLAYLAGNAVEIVREAARKNTLAMLVPAAGTCS